MKEKRETCLYCERRFEPKTTRALFCSDKCRVYHAREKKAVGGGISLPGDYVEIKKVAVASNAPQISTIAPGTGEMYLGVPVPPELKGWDLTVWKAEIRDGQR